MVINKKDYLDIIYDKDIKPFTNYPNQLTKYLVDRYHLKIDSSLLDVGCGRGEFTYGFKKCGLNTFAVDQSNVINNYFPDLVVKVADIEKEGIPYSDNTFDVVYSKSLIEHFYNPKIYVDEIYRILKPGGIAITMTPAWEYNYKIFYEDYTHRTPFMFNSLEDILKIGGFENVKVEYFRQLPLLWKYKFLFPLAEFTRLFIPDNYYKFNPSKPINKWIKFSKEVMLLATSRKNRF